MELWIRSQDKRHLIKADYISIMENNIINVANSGWDYDVAKYKSKERALEVLDEIQDILDTKKSYEKIAHLITKDTKVIEFSNVIYEMPKE